MVSIKIDVNKNEVTRSLNRTARKQIPFALAGALTATAFDAQRAVKKNIRKKYILRNKFTEQGVRVIKANKNTQTAVVFFDDKRFYMSRQQFGATLRPGNKHLAVPVRIRASKQKRVTPARRPRRILNNANVFKVDIGEQSHLEPGIYQRFKSGKLKMLYAFEKDIRIRPTLNFDKTVIGVVNSRFNKNFVRSLNRALRTAR